MYQVLRLRDLRSLSFDLTQQKSVLQICHYAQFTDEEAKSKKVGNIWGLCRAGTLAQVCLTQRLCLVSYRSWNLYSRAIYLSSKIAGAGNSVIFP